MLVVSNYPTTDEVGDYLDGERYPRALIRGRGGTPRQVVVGKPLCRLWCGPIDWPWLISWQWRLDLLSDVPFSGAFSLTLAAQFYCPVCVCVLVCF